MDFPQFFLDIFGNRILIAVIATWFGGSAQERVVVEAVPPVPQQMKTATAPKPAPAPIAKKEAVIEEKAAPQKLNKQGDLTAEALAKVVELKSFRLQTPGQLDEGALKDWAEGQQLKAGLA